jgi:endonuclease/exonuclease/phosphatase family metal-dependent hydrolase
MGELRLVSANIERSKHLDRVVPFLQEQNADIVCLQECMERDIPLFESIIGPKLIFTPLCFFLARPPEEHDGVYAQAIFSKHKLISSSQEYYAGQYDPLPDFGEDKEDAIQKVARALSAVEIEKEGAVFRIATTHFTWSKHGEATDLQQKDLQLLFSLLEPLGEFVLTGDFNAPRGRATFDALAARYKDNIPAHYTTSIDPQLHRAGALELMVDGLFTTPQYSAKNVALQSGISDHCVITATITKVG